MQNGTMLVQCPSCHTTYGVSDSLIATPNPTFRCSRCKHIFILGVRAEENPSHKGPVISQDEEEDRELSFPFPPPERKKDREENDKESFDFSEPEEPPVANSPDQWQPESPNLQTDESFPSPEEILAPRQTKERLSPTTDEEQPSPLIKEREERWAITPPHPQDEKPFTIPEENRFPQMETATELDPKLEEDWQISYPLPEERETDTALDPQRGRPVSILPYIGLFGALLLIYSLLTLMHQTQPKTIETLIKNIPWLGSSVLKNNHLRKEISLQSLRPSVQKIPGNQEVFVVSGVAVNRNPVSVREVQIEGQIYNGEGKEIGHQAIWIGNAVSLKIISGLTAQDIPLLQRMSPLKRFEIPPEGSAAFVIVFFKPSGEIKNFSCRVLSAEGTV